MARTLLLHLSDLHLCQPAERAPKPGLWDSLADAIRSVVTAEAPDRVAVAITGDLIDSSQTPAPTACAAITGVVNQIRQAVQGEAPSRSKPCPIALLPGNHDRRASGAISPWSHELVRELGGALSGAGVTLFAADEHEPLAARVPALSEVLGAEVVAYDSTHTLPGKFSSGGLFRSEDLMAIRSLANAERPVIVLMHHHLVPTPITDVGLVDSSKAGVVGALVVNRLLPWIVTFGNREELFMTALGAGTALTLLHALGSAVIVLHGHKHYPTARVLKSTAKGDGDVLLASAGSAGLLEPYAPSGPNDPAFLWPSFNALWIDGATVDVETVFFSPDAPKPVYRQSLASARRAGATWTPRPVDEPLVARDEILSDTATFTLTKGAVGYWDLACERLIVPAIAGLAAYEEPIAATRGAEVTGARISQDAAGGRWRIEVVPNEVARYRSTRALFRSVVACVAETQGRGRAEDFSPFESLGLHVQRGSRIATMTVRGLPDIAERGFATLTDLHTGQERPIAMQPSDGDGVRIVVEPCPARRLIRLYWPLDASG